MFGTVKSLFWLQDGMLPPKKRKEEQDVILGKPTDNAIHVIVRSSARDPKSKRIVYTTEESIPVYEATPEQVVGVVRRALENAAK